MNQNKSIVHMQAYNLAKQYTKGFFSALPIHNKMMTPDIFDAVQSAIFNSFVDGYHQGAKDMEDIKGNTEHEKK